MAKILMRIPSKMIQYGYIEMELDLPTEDPRLAADAYMMHVSEFQMGEMNFVKSKQAAHSAAPEPVSEPPSEAPDDGPEGTDEAAATLAEGLGGVTVVEDEEAPWNKAPAESTVQSNAWDTEPKFDFDWS